DGVARTLTWDGTSHTYSLSGTEGVSPSAVTVTVSVGAEEILSKSVSTTYGITCTDLSLPIDSVCKAGTGTFSLLKDGAAYTGDRSSVLSAQWEDSTAVAVTYVPGDGSYTLPLSVSTTGAHTLTLLLDSASLTTESVTLAQSLNPANTDATWSLPTHATEGGDIAFQCTPKDDCDNTMTAAVVSYVACAADGVTCEDQGTLVSASSYAVTDQIASEGVYTYTLSVDGAEVHSDTIDIAPVFVTVGSDTVGVSSTHSTLTGLPTGTE
ncbi:hypothetical protein KIPB_014686, partial [Kipferlia bialata]